MTGQEPRDPRAEDAVIGAMMHGADHVAAAVGAVRPGDFTSAARQLIFETIASMHARSMPADPITIYDELRRAGRADQVGGALELVRILESVPGPANVLAYCAIVRRLAWRRAVIDAAERLARDAANLDVKDDLLVYEPPVKGEIKTWTVLPLPTE